MIFNSANEANRPIKKSKPKIYQRAINSKKDRQPITEMTFHHDDGQKKLQGNAAGNGQASVVKPPRVKKRKLPPTQKNKDGSRRFALDFNKLTPVRQQIKQSESVG